MIRLINIYKKDLFDNKIKIYHEIIKIITKSKCNEKYLLNKYLGLCFQNQLDLIVLENIIVKIL